MVFYNNTSVVLSSEQRDRLKRIRHVALDLDGTLYLGKTLFPFTAAFLQSLDRMGIGYTFLTNNPSESVEQYLLKLRSMGIPAEREQLYTSTLATIDYLKNRLPEAKRLFLLGTPGMTDDFRKAGYEPLPDSPNEKPDAVIVGFDKTLTYDRLCRASWWISQGVPYVATNPDFVCPTDQPNVLVDCGSICAALEASTGRKPDKTLGKPDPAMLTGILERHGLQPEEVAMVGDRLYTDMEMARRAGALGVLVLSGETTAEQALRVELRPDLIVENVSEFSRLLEKNNR